MALIGYTITVVAKQDNPYNVLPETDISIRKNSDNTLVNIYADEAGLIPIAQLGAKTDSNGQFTFYADASLGMLKAVWTNGGVIATEVLDQGDHSRLVNRNASGAHDASAISLLQGGSLQDSIDFVTPEMFGAVGDGNNDHSSLLMAFSSGLPVKLSSGKVYGTTQSVKVSVSGDLVIYGGGTIKALSGFDTTGDENGIISIDGGGTARIVIDGIAIDGNKAENVYADWLNFIHGMYVNNADSICIKNNVVYNTPSIGILASRANRVYITNNTCAGNEFHQINGKLASYVEISGNKCIGTGDKGIDPAVGGIGILYGLSNKVLISNNFITNTPDTGSKTEGCSDVIYSNNILENLGKDGIKIQGFLGQTELPLRAVIQGNIVKDLYPWRDDGSTCIQVSDMKHVTVSGNVVSSDYSSTLASRNGIRTFNHYNGTVGQTGFQTVTGNEVGITYEDASGYASISMVGADGGGHTQTITGNVCAGRIVAGDGYGATTITGNIVGADAFANLSRNDNGITMYARDAVVSSNVVYGFNIPIVFYNTGPSDGIYSWVCSSNQLNGCTLRAIDMGADDNAASRSVRIAITDNSFSDIKIGNTGAIRVRHSNLKINSLMVANNTFSGDFRYMLEHFGAQLSIGDRANISDNIMNSTRTDFYESLITSLYKKVTGTQAYSTTQPDSSKDYSAGDLILHPYPSVGENLGWRCTNKANQYWVSIGVRNT